MNVIVEKKEIVGTLKTSFGSYRLLNPRHTYNANTGIGSFEVLDSEGFVVYVTTKSEWLIEPFQFPKHVDVKRVLTEQEAQGVEILTAATID